MKKTFLFLFSIILSVLSFAQSPRVADFFIRPTNTNEVLVVWTMEAGSTCPSLSVERSTDNTTFKSVYMYPSVCGFEDRAITYSWVDDQPNNYAVNYYRLNLDDIEYTIPVKVDLQSNLANNDALVYPNPSQGEINIDHKNPNNLNYSVSLFSTKGEMITREENLNGRSHSLTALHLKDGFYIIRILYSNGSAETINISVSN